MGGGKRRIFVGDGDVRSLYQQRVSTRIITHMTADLADLELFY